MLRMNGVEHMRTLSVTLAAGTLALRTLAAWNGAGTPGGDPAATNINDSANWVGGILDNNFTTIVSNATLRLTANYTVTNGLNFVELDKSLVHHIVVDGTNTLTLNGVVPGYAANANKNLYMPSNAASSVTLSKGLVINMPGDRTVSGFGALFADAKFTGAGGFLPTWANGHSPIIVLRNDANDFTGYIGGDNGRLHFTSIADKGVPCALGAGTLIAPNNYFVIFVGSRDMASNRDFSFMHLGVGLYNDSACGALSLTGNVYAASHNNTRFHLGGISAGEGLITKGLANANAGSYTRIRKVDSGTWRLTGNNTFTGYTNIASHIDIEGGRLVADYRDDVSGAGSNRLFLAGRNVYYSDGTLEILGKMGAGNTTWQLLGTNLVNNNSLNILKADANGGDGTTVALGEIISQYDYGFLRLERSGNATVYATNAIASDVGSVRTVNGMLLSKDGTRANVLLRDPDGRVGFATQNAAFEFVRHTNKLVLTENNAAKTDHVSLSSGLTRTANLNFSTLAIDASANAVELNLNGYAFQTDNSAVGRGVLVSGGNPVTICGGTHGAQSSTYLHNYGTGKLSWGLTNSGSCTLAAAGPGLTEISQPVLSNFVISEGVVRLTQDRSYAEGIIYIFGGGVLEIGADLNGAGTAGDFSRWYGNDIGSNRFYLTAGGGFSAYGADRTVILNNNAGMVAYWAAVGFVPGGKPFILSSPHANATLIFQNIIALGANRREIRVQNGSAAVDARLTGRIYGTGPAGLVKSGAGTLELTGKQDYRGDCSVIGGGLRLGANDVYAGGTNALVLSGATLDAGTFRNTFDTLELLADSVLEAGDGSATLAFADSSAKTWTGTLTINGKLTAATLRFGTDGKGLTAAQLAAITNRDRPVCLDDQGYLRQIPGGTILFLQ